MELTVPNLYKVLKDLPWKNSTDSSYEKESFQSDHIFTLYSKKLLDTFFKEYKILKIPINITHRECEKSRLGDWGRPIIDEIHEYKNRNIDSYSNREFIFENGFKILKNITVLNIERLYPTIITKLTEYGEYNLIDHSKEDPFEEEIWSDGNIDKLIWNIPEFSVLLKYLLENEENLIHDKKGNVDLKIKSILEIIFNGVYINLMQKNFLKVNNNELIPYYISEKLLNTLIKKYENNLIFFKPDSICFLNFEKIKNGVFENLNSLNFKYDIKEYKNMIYFGLNQYVFIEEISEIKGLKYLDSSEGLLHKTEKYKTLHKNGIYQSA